MEIRRLAENDNLLEISNIYERSWKYAYKDIIPQHYLDSIPSGQWANGIKKHLRNNLVLTENGVAIGTACFCKSRWEKFSDYGEIVSIYFLPEYIGKGYGTFLLNKCIEELNQLGYNKILLWVLEYNHRARSFYEKNGFVCSEEFLNTTIGGQELSEVMYFIQTDSGRSPHDKV